MKKHYWWIIGLTILILTIFGVWSIANRAYSAENTLEAMYQREFYDLIEKIDNIDILLSKSLVTSSDSQRVMLLTTIWHQAEGARESLSTLPLGQYDISTTLKYLAQLGDFCYNLADKITKNEEIVKGDWEKLQTLKNNTQKLNHHLRKLQAGVTSGNFEWGQNLTLNRISKDTQIADNFSKIDQKLKEEFPTIIYDGPFSDHVENTAPKNLTGSLIKEKQAIKNAEKFLKNVTESKYDLCIISKVNGIIPAYTVECRQKGKSEPEYVMDISEKGGHILWFLSTRDIEREKISIKKAVKNAEKFLSEIGYRNMAATGSLREKGSVVINFVPKQEEILLYPDFMKVEVALDNGQIVAFDSTAYVTFHHPRRIPEKLLSEQEILKKINQELKIRRIRKVIIPKQDKSERLCFEVDVNLNDERYFIYLNAVNGNEEHIFKVVETNKGTMTM